MGYRNPKNSTVCQSLAFTRWLSDIANPDAPTSSATSSATALRSTRIRTTVSRKTGALHTMFSLLMGRPVRRDTPGGERNGLGRSSFFGGNYENGELQDPLGPNWRPVNRGRHPMVVPAGVENEIKC